MIRVDIPEPAADVIAVLEKYGYEAYVVGGCVRDSILGREPSDWDVTTSCAALSTKTIFDETDGFDAYDTGMKHGTVTVVRKGVSIEVTTFRVEYAYLDHRHPKLVYFTEQLEKDLARRDFTVNAIAYSERCGLIDPWGGVRDIERQIIRCVGDPKTRFDEDALRILRALRFASQLGFDIHPDTADAASELAHTIVHISRERVTSELTKLLLGGGAARVMRYFPDVLYHACPMLNELYIISASDTVERLCGAALPLMLAALLADADRQLTDTLFKWLRFDKKTVSRTLAILRAVEYLPLDKPMLKRLCRDVGFENVRDAVRLAAARDTDVGDAMRRLNEIESRGECYTPMALNIDGHDLLALGCERHRIGEVLSELLDMVIDGRLENDGTVLIAKAKTVIGKDTSADKR